MSGAGGGGAGGAVEGGEGQEEQEEQEEEEEGKGDLNLRELKVLGRKGTFSSASAPDSIIHPHTFDAPFSIP